MYKVKFILIIFFWHCLVYSQSDSQGEDKLFLEIAGSGGVGSFNYEWTFAKKIYSEYTLRLGISLAPIDKNNGVSFIFPIMLNTLIGKSAHKVELGLGQGLTITTKGNLFSLTTLVAGYRFQPEAKNWFLRVSYTPLVSYLYDFQVQQWAGVSFGFKLRKMKE